MNLPQIIKPKRHADGRGWFSETFRETWLRDMGLACVLFRKINPIQKRPAHCEECIFKSHRLPKPS